MDTPAPRDAVASQAARASEPRWASPATRRIATVLAVATLCRVIVVELIKMQPFADAQWYFTHAADIAAGKGYVSDAVPTAYFPVGYPATLAAVFSVFGTSLQSALYLNVVLSVATLGCVYFMGLRLLGDRGVACTAAALLGFLPNQIFSCCVPMSEITFVFLLCLGICICLRSKWLDEPWWGFVAGLVFGWAALVRSQGAVIPFLVVPLIVHYRGSRPLLSLRGLRPLVMLAAGLVVTVGPWVYRNQDELGEATIATNGGENLLIGNNENATGRITSLAPLYPPGIDRETLTEVGRDHLTASMAKRYILRHPLAAVARVPKKIWYLYRSDGGVTNWIWDRYRTNRSLGNYAFQGVTSLAYLAVVVIGFVWLLRRRERTPDEQLFRWIALSVIIYFTAIAAIFFGDARFHQPMLPGLAIAAAVPVTRMLRRRLAI